MKEHAVQLLQLLYFMLPAYLANMVPPFVRFWRGWNRPIHARLLGSHKTVVGFAAGVATAVLTTAVQAWIASPLDLLDRTCWPLWGLAFGFGAMAGDTVKSFCKRRLRIAPGKPWLPFDQIDFALGALLLVGPSAGLSIRDVVQVVTITFLGDMAVNRIAFRLGIKDTPW